MFKRKSAFSLILFALLLLVATQVKADNNPSPDPSAGKIIKKNGFTSKKDGYSFANYGSDDNYQDLTKKQMIQIYGRQVCINENSSDPCILETPARKWMQSLNKAMSGGHCFGFASTSQFFFTGSGNPRNPDKFGASSVPDLQIKNNAPLQSHIAEAFSYQAFPSVQETKIDNSPKLVVNKLKKSLQKDKAPYLLGIYDNGDGHAITPLALNKVSKNKMQIIVYDNNWPGTRRAVNVNLKENTWSYVLAPNMVWSGGAKTESLSLFKPGAGLGRQPCPFCSNKKNNFLQLHWLGTDRVNSKDKLRIEQRRSQERAGCTGSRCYTNIKNSHMYRLATGVKKEGLQKAAPTIFDLPDNSGYQVKLKGDKKVTKEGINLIGNGYSLQADKIRLSEKDKELIRVSKQGHRILYENDGHGTEKPELGLSLQKKNKDYFFILKPKQLKENAKLVFRVNKKKDKLKIKATKKTEVRLVIKIASAQGVKKERVVKLASNKPFNYSY